MSSFTSNGIRLSLARVNDTPGKSVLLPVNQSVVLFLGLLLLAGCATSTVESRKQERSAAYAALPAEEKELVDNGHIKVGMSQDAVYMAWGRPAEILQRESGNSGLQNIWLYHGTAMRETRYWTFREVPYQGTIFLERYLDRDYDPQDYVRAEIIFAGDKVASWRTLPRPLY